MDLPAYKKKKKGVPVSFISEDLEEIIDFVDDFDRI